MDKLILRKFLKAGFMENGTVHPTSIGTPQGGSISPTLAVMTLSGLEGKLRSGTQRERYREKINVISYADDFIVTAASEELLKEKVIPLVQEFLQEVGLELSIEKTRITPIQKGFDFLGFNIRKYENGKLLIKPSKANIKRFLEEIRRLIKASVALPTDKMIYLLNPKITGWVNYYRSVVSSRTFSMIDEDIFQALTRWGIKRHSNKGKWWIVNKYYTPSWRFYCTLKGKGGTKTPLYLKKAANTPIRRHRKILAQATPFNRSFKDYFKQREKERKASRAFSMTADSAGLRNIQPYEGLSGVLGN